MLKRVFCVIAPLILFMTIPCNIPIICFFLGSIQIRVSVVVLGELEGLTKSRDQTERPEHAAMLRQNSKAALTWIREKPANVKCVTTKGKECIFNP